MVLGNAVSSFKMFIWILNHVSRSITWSLFTLRASNPGHQTWSNDYSRRDLSCGGVRLSIGLKFGTRSNFLRNFGMI